MLEQLARQLCGEVVSTGGAPAQEALRRSIESQVAGHTKVFARWDAARVAIAAGDGEQRHAREHVVSIKLDLEVRASASGRTSSPHARIRIQGPCRAIQLQCDSHTVSCDATGGCGLWFVCQAEGHTLVDQFEWDMACPHNRRARPPARPPTLPTHPPRARPRACLRAWRSRPSCGVPTRAREAEQRALAEALTPRHARLGAGTDAACAFSAAARSSSQCSSASA